MIEQQAPEKKQLRHLLLAASFASYVMAAYFGYHDYLSFRPTYLLFTIAFLLAGVGVDMYFLTARATRKAANSFLPAEVYDVVFIGLMCLAIVELYSSDFYRSLGFFLAVTGAFVVLLSRAVLSDAEVLKTRRIFNVAESYTFVFFLFVSPLYLNFVPRWWDTFYHFVNTQQLVTTGYINIAQTYQGFPSFYVFNAMLVSAGFGVQYINNYLVVDAAIESAGILAVYLTARYLGGERAGLAGMLAAGATSFYTDFQLVPAWVSLALFFYGMYLLVARGKERGGFIALILIATGLLFYHPIGTLALAAFLVSDIVVYLYSHRRVERQNILIMYLAIALTYMLYLAPATFQLLVSSYSSPAPGAVAIEVASFDPYYLVFYAPLVTTILFGGYFLAKSLAEGLSRAHLLVAVFPPLAAMVGFVQIFAGVSITESVISSLLPLLLLIPVGLSIGFLSNSRLMAILCIMLMGTVFLAAVTGQGDGPYFGNADFSGGGSRPYGTSQQIAAVTFFEKVPQGANVSADIITGSWGDVMWGLQGLRGLPAWRAIGLGEYANGTYLVYAATPFPASAFAGDPDQVIPLLQNLTLAGDVVYSSGSVTGLFHP